jgi:KDO transferase-3
MDLNENAGRFYEDKENGLPTALDEQFDKLILPSFLFVSKKIIHDDFRVFNLSLNSRLPGTIIPKITLDQLDHLLATE